MAKFEVFIPAVSADLPVDMTLRIEAANWLAALKVGLEKICGAQLASNILVDAADDGSVDVTDPATGRVFRIVELSATPAPEPGRTALPAPAPARAPAAPAVARPAPPTAPAARRAPPAPPRVQKVEKPKSAPARRIGRAPHELHREAALEAVFLKVPQLQAVKKREDGLGFLLELAMERIACDTALALLTEGGGFAFKAGRGLKAEETLRAGIPIPLGDGIVGFCGQELVCLAVSDVEKDPRFFRRIHEELPYPTRSMLVCPIVKQGRVFGALQLKNKKGGAFDEGDLAVLSYLAHHAAGFLERRELETPFAAPPGPRGKRT